jgi:short-subunit dehydrogenase
MQIAGTALITGASTGIGAVYANRLARRGHRLILVARSRERLDTVADALETEVGHRPEIIVADLMNDADLRGVEQRLRDDAQIDLLVNNAGIALASPLLGGDLDRLEGMVRLNVVAAMRLAIAAGDSFAARGRGTIVNIASVLALAPERFNGVYSGTKAFLLNLSLALRGELAPKGVRVQAVLPGATRTELWQKAGRDVTELPVGMVMEAGEMVDAALAGLDQGEAVTIPSLPDPADWNRFEAARQALGPNLSHQHPAARYAPTLRPEQPGAAG